MFSGLDEIDWARLIHAYGAASDVPDDIRALVSSDEKTAKDALWRLFGNIYHQGTRYSATVPAIPFLAEAACALAPERAARVLALLSAIAEPAADRIYDDQLTIEAFRAAVQEDENALSPDALAECRRFGCLPTVEAKVYDAVIAQIPHLIGALDLSDRDIQIALFELLENAPAHYEDAKTLAENTLSAGGADEPLKVAAVECLSRLSRSVEVAHFRDFFDRFAKEDSSPFLKVHVALATSDATGAGLDELLAALDQSETLYQADRTHERAKGWTVSRIARALKPQAPNDKDRICAALMHALPAAQNHNADTTVLVDALVITLAHPLPPKDFFSNRPSKDLTSLERQVLEHIVTFGTWKIGSQWFGNFTMQLASYGLPDRPADLQTYLKTEKTRFMRWL